MSVVVEPRAAHDASYAAPELAGLRVLLVHEWLYTWAGAERCLEQLVMLMPHADVLAGIVDPRLRERHDVVRRARESWVGSLPGARTKHRWFLPLHALAFPTVDTSSYDLVLSISHAFEKSIRARKTGGVHVSYCLTPPRYLWDLSVEHDRMATPVERLALKLARAPLRAVDRFAARGVDRFVSLSHVVADRVHRAYGRQSSVVYPPVSLPAETQQDAGREDFLLSIGRLVRYKRVDLAIAAAGRLGSRLVVAGDGPERRRLERLAGPAVEFIGEISDEEKTRLLRQCAAFVFCAEEDFGIAPLEANGCGAPVVAYGKGGATETLTHGHTAVFFDRQTPDAVADAITRCLDTAWDRAALRANAERFSPRRFREGMRGEIRRAMSARGAS